MSSQLKKNGFFVIPLVVFMLLVFARLSWAAASSPLQLIQSGTDKVLVILHQSAAGEAHPLRQREAEILDIVSDYFNFDEMAKRSLGPAWNQLSPEKREQFAELFKKLLFNTYVDRMENYHNEKIIYDSQKVSDDYAIVKTHFIYQGEDIQIDYKLRKEGEQWRVYDVVVEDVSYVANYRSQIASILTNQSFDSLLEILRRKVGRSG